MDLKIFVDTDSDERLSRRLLRDICARGRQIEDVLLQYETSVKPAYDTYIAPTMSMADIIIPGGGENAVAIDLIVRVVERRLKEHSHQLRSEQANGLRQSFSQMRLNDSSVFGLKNATTNGGADSENSTGSTPGTPDGGPSTFPWGDGGSTLNIDPSMIPARVNVLPATPESRCLHTMLRDRNTNQDAFIFYAERLMRPVCEFAYRLLPYEVSNYLFQVLFPL